MNNALTIILSGAESLRLNSTSAKERSEILLDVQNAAQAAAATAKQLIAFSRGMPDDGGPADPGRRHRGAHTKSDPVVSRGHPRRTRSAPLVRASPWAKGMLTQVVLNLAINARDACRDGGNIRIQCGAEDDAVHIRISDDGAGMDQATRERIFEPFFTTKEREGSGMGLPMVQAAVGQIGGELHVESAPDRGTLVDIKLPIAPNVCVADPVPVAPPDSQSSSHILLVEDQPELLRAMSRELKYGGFHVTMTSTVRDATSALSQTNFDLLCTDGILPDGRAHDVIAALIASKGQATPGAGLFGLLARRARPRAVVQRDVSAQALFTGRARDHGSLPCARSIGPGSVRALTRRLLHALKRTTCRPGAAVATALEIRLRLGGILRSSVPLHVVPASKRATIGGRRGHRP